MVSDNHDNTPGKRTGDAPAAEDSPEWANGLRQLYDSVVDEPLPDSFKNLLDQLDNGDDSNEGDPSPSCGEGGAS